MPFFSYALVRNLRKNLDRKGRVHHALYGSVIVFAFIGSWRSTPRVRGPHRLKSPTLLTKRFSPACAGTTRASTATRFSVAVQPRVCGDHRFDANVFGCHPRFSPACAGTTRRPSTCRNTRSGSAPRVRGPLASSGAPESDGRFSPACAGTTAAPHAGRPACAVQPRVCGDHVA